jgi:hypothetical protein
MNAGFLAVTTSLSFAQAKQAVMTSSAIFKPRHAGLAYTPQTQALCLVFGEPPRAMPVIPRFGWVMQVLFVVRSEGNRVIRQCAKAQLAKRNCTSGIGFPHPNISAGRREGPHHRLQLKRANVLSKSPDGEVSSGV